MFELTLNYKIILAKCSVVAGLKISFTGNFLTQWTYNYTGGLLFNTMNGKGTYIDATGATFEGYFIENKREGPGRFYLADNSTSWIGEWTEDILHSSQAELVVRRPDIFGKHKPLFDSKVIKQSSDLAIESVKYKGGVKDGLVHGQGTITAYIKNGEWIFSFESHFLAGTLRTFPKAPITIQWNPKYKPSNFPTISLSNWKSNWNFGVQSVSGNVSLDKHMWGYDGHYLTTMNNASKENYNNISDQSLEDIIQVLDTIRAFEWHFIYHKLRLKPLMPLLDPFPNKERNSYEMKSEHEESEMDTFATSTFTKNNKESTKK